MKKFILLSMFMIGMFVNVNAQNPDVQTLAQSGDTVTNTETEYLTVTIRENYEQVVFQYVCNKLSGTVAGTATLQASLNNSNWIDLDTLTNTNVSAQTFFFDVTTTTPNKYKYYRVVCTGSGTMAARVYCYALPRKKG